MTDTHATVATGTTQDGKPVDWRAQIKRLTGYSDLAVVEDVRVAMEAFAAENPQVQIKEAYNTITADSSRTTARR